MKKQSVSKIRKLYIMRLIGRCVILLICIFLYKDVPAQLEILQDIHFFKNFSLLHLLWIIWMIDMIFQLIPVHKHISLGSQKLFLLRFQPIREKINYQALREYVISTTRSAYKIFILWAALLAVIGFLYMAKVLGNSELFLISVIFYVCDLICVLIWCPFRLILKNRCCTTCRIFNWDHLMMFTPMLFIHGFYSDTLLLLALAVWIVWELCVMMYPERFWENSNASLRCSECTDKLCTQYCKKLRNE